MHLKLKLISRFLGRTELTVPDNNKAAASRPQPSAARRLTYVALLLTQEPQGMVAKKSGITGHRPKAKGFLWFVSHSPVTT